MFNALDRTAGHVYSRTVKSVLNLVLSKIYAVASFYYFGCIAMINNYGKTLQYG